MAEIRIFYSERTLTLTDKAVDGATEAQDQETFDKAVATFESSDAQTMVVRGESVEALLAMYLRTHRLITAAGGVIVRDGRCLVIRRRGYLDLPKGKTEGDETPVQTAVREVAEEVGLSGMKIERQEPSTYHTYRIEKDGRSELVVKRTDWFRMLLEDRTKEPVLQTEEDIIGSEWMEAEKMRKSAGETYASLRPLFQAFA